ncbi:MAG: carboxypeptidase-like regulatory domain-containing protein, partial [Bacteroidota bacterium]
MRQRWYRLLVLSMLAIPAGTIHAYAGQGQISGVVRDADGGPIAGANILLEGTPFGTSADENGKYRLLNVSVGTYRIRASAVGFVAQVVTGVRVGEDQVVMLDFELQSDSLDLTEIVVQALQPPVDISQTNPRTRFQREEFTTLPVRSVEDLVAISASNYKAFIRGGKPFETRVFVDGIDMTDQFAAWYN